MKKMMVLLALLSGAGSGTLHAETLQQNRALCASCHGAQGEGNQTLAAPRLAGQNGTFLEHQLQSFKAGKRGYHPDDQAGNRMRAVAQKLSDADITQLAAQFAGMTVARKVTDSKVGRDLYSSTCMSCHGQYGQGYAQLQSPNLNILAPWYLSAQIDAYNKGWRGAADDQDLPALMMRTIASHISTQKELNEVIDYIGGLSVPVGR